MQYRAKAVKQPHFKHDQKNNNNKGNMLFPCGILIKKTRVRQELEKGNPGYYGNLHFVRDSVGLLQIWGMFLFGPSPHVIDFDDVSSQYEGKYIVL